MPVNRPFTTEPNTRRHIKRGCRIVRNRSIQFIKTLKEKYNCTQEIPLSQAKRVWQIQEGNPCDPASLKKYFGTQMDKVKKVIQRRATYQTGTVSNKTIELTENIPTRQGYFELFGLVTYEKRGKAWFLIMKNGEGIVPEIAKSSTAVDEALCKSIPNFSLSPIDFGTPKDECELSHVETAERRERE